MKMGMYLAAAAALFRDAMSVVEADKVVLGSAIARQLHPAHSFVGVPKRSKRTVGQDRREAKKRKAVKRARRLGHA